MGDDSEAEVGKVEDINVHWICDGGGPLLVERNLPPEQRMVVSVEGAAHDAGDCDHARMECVKHEEGVAMKVAHDHGTLIVMSCFSNKPCPSPHRHAPRTL